MKLAFTIVLIALLSISAYADCGSMHNDQASCDADKTTDGGCTWCFCSAVPDNCYSTVDAKRLP